MPSQNVNQMSSDILAQAADWHARMASAEASEADWLGYTEWLEADPRHRSALDLVEQADRYAGDNAAALKLEIDTAVERADRNRVVAFKPLSGSTISRRGIWMGAASALAASVAVAVILRPPEKRAPTATQYATVVGEQREIALADGSRVTLNTNSRLTVAFADDVRQVSLDQGEAFFDVAKDSQRPFLVNVGDQQVRVVGTAFNILHHDGAITVAVARGIVDVETRLASGANPPHARLTVGDQLHHVIGERSSTASKSDPAQVASWQSGRLVFVDAPLADVVSQINRYFTPQISTGASPLGDIRFSGVIQIDDPQSVVRRLEGFLPITAQTTSDGFILSRKNGD